MWVGYFSGYKRRNENERMFKRSERHCFIQGSVFYDNKK